MNWYAVNTKFNQENLVLLNLKNLGVETFYPKLSQHKMIRRRLQTTIGPLFPGYLFAKFNMDIHYRAVNYARGVRKVVMFGSIPAIIDEEVIESLKSMLDDRFVAVQWKHFIPGQAVRIQSGPLRGLEGIFVREMSDHQRGALLLNFLSHQARVVLDLANIFED